MMNSEGKRVICDCAQQGAQLVSKDTSFPIRGNILRLPRNEFDPGKCHRCIALQQNLVVSAGLKLKTPTISCCVQPAGIGIGVLFQQDNELSGIHVQKGYFS